MKEIIIIVLLGVIVLLIFALNLNKIETFNIDGKDYIKQCDTIYEVKEVSIIND